jgi:hypothetical protein
MFLTWRIPVDQFDNRPEDLAHFVEVWNEATGRNDCGGDLVHYMKTQRKRGLWVRLDGNYVQAPELVELSADETEALVEIFYENVTLLDNGSDVLSYDEEIANLIAKEFFAATHKIVSSHHLVAKLTALRKRGLLPKVGKRGQHPPIVPVEGDSIGFEDINQVRIDGPREAI